MYHPNIDLEGNVCLNILREDWKPVLSINSIIYGLQFLFMVSCMPCILTGQARACCARQSEQLCAIAIAWKPGAMHGSVLALQDPNPEDPLNQEAAAMFSTQRRQFEAQVQMSITRGSYISGTYFPPCRA